MKKFVLLIFCLCSLSCIDKNSVTTKGVQENVMISSDETFEFLLGTAIPVEGGYSISQQAEHFEVSEIQHRQHGIFYIYKPESGFTGKEVIKITRADSNGAEIISETVTTLNIEVTE